jgi:hypothetical protein
MSRRFKETAESLICTSGLTAGLGGSSRVLMVQYTEYRVSLEMHGTELLRGSTLSWRGS